MRAIRSPLELSSAPLLIGPPTEIGSQQELAELIFKLLGLGEFEQRFSDNYPPSFHYFIAKLGSGSLKLREHDDVGRISKRFPYALVLDQVPTDGDGVQVFDWLLVARTLSENGFHAFLCEEIWNRAESYEGWLFSPGSPNASQIRLEN